jgi:NADH:ubiquinone oxidoreductase subunit 5 (subunit L)/multisubunit Na+/H+ antiporter MnhA subunit
MVEHLTNFPYLTCMVLSPVIGILIILFLKEDQKFLIRATALVSAAISLGFSMYTFTTYDKALGGIALAWLDWGAPRAKCVGFISHVPVLENFFIQKWYMDHFWRWFLNRVIYGTFSKWFTYNDRRVVDGGVDAVAFTTVGGGRYLSLFQTALLQLNLLFMVLVVAGIGLYLVMG